jgi:nitroimidazol reductase NimA-like FMN-containing flavoprotein (pyridoxamine 5'-phosphate oxidase superfamily)
MNPLSTTDRTTLTRSKERGQTGRTALYEVLDAGLICHLGVIVNGSPRVMPTGYGRVGDTLYLHGSTGARSLQANGEVCVTVTPLDGIVMARSTFHHSVNYRSALVFGTPRVAEGEEKLTGLRAITERLAPGQWDTARRPNKKELAATVVLALGLDEASVKVRTGPPLDDEEDHALDVWAGVLPVRVTFGEPVSDPLLRPGIEVPEDVRFRCP